MKASSRTLGEFIALALFIFASATPTAHALDDGGGGTGPTLVPTYFENGTLSVAVGSAAVFGSSGCRGACEAALIAHGFRRLRRHEVALDISNDFLGWVGLNTGNYATHVKVNPFVGIHCIPLMRMIANLESQKYRVGSVATYAVRTLASWFLPWLRSNSRRIPTHRHKRPDSPRR